MATPNNGKKRLFENASTIAKKKRAVDVFESSRPSQHFTLTNSATPNPRSPLGIASSGVYEDTGNRGALNPKRWRPSYDTAEISEIIKMSNQEPNSNAVLTEEQLKNHDGVKFQLKTKPRRGQKQQHFMTSNQ